MQSRTSQDMQNHLCKVCDAKGGYAAKCRNPQSLSVIKEFKKGASRYLQGLNFFKTSIWDHFICEKSVRVGKQYYMHFHHFNRP